MTLFPELDQKSLSELQEIFRADYPYTDTPEEKELWFQEVAIRIVRRGNNGLSFLINNISSADSARLRAILLSFSFIEGDAATQQLDELKRLLLSFLRHPDPMLTAEAIDSLNYLRFADVCPEVTALLTHSSPYVIGSVLRYLTRHDPEQAKRILPEFLKSPEPIVRQNAIDELAALQYREALPCLYPLLEDENPDVRQAAQTAVSILQCSENDE